MEEALIEDIREYPSLLKLFTRQLKDGARTVSTEYSLVSVYLTITHVIPMYMNDVDQRRSSNFNPIKFMQCPRTAL